jgi:uncharacterized SAM-binding protein YcdF (DUF218 family)
MLRKKILWRIALSLAGLITALLLIAYLWPERALTIDDGLRQADVIVLLGGGSGERPTRAAELYRSNAAPKILVSGAGDTDGNRLLLLNRGVPARAISLESNSRTTRENALLSIPLLRAAGARRVIVVTTWYHSRRALDCFRHYAPDLVFYSCPSYYGYARSEWSRGRLRRRIHAEYAKLLGYWFYYGVCPF